MVKRKVHKWTAYCPLNDICQRKGHLGSFLSVEGARRSMRDHLVNSSKHYMDSEEAMDVATAYDDLEPWTDEEESCDLRKQAHSYDSSRRKKQKAPIGALQLKPNSSSQSSTTRPKSPSGKGIPPKKSSPAAQDGATSSSSTDAIAVAVATAVAAHLAAQAKAAPAMIGMMASSTEAVENQAADAEPMVLTVTNDQGIAMGCAWTKAVNTIVRAEAAARKASAYATTCAEAFAEVAYTLKKQIEILENLGVYQPGSADS